MLFTSIIYRARVRSKGKRLPLIPTGAGSILLEKKDMPRKSPVYYIAPSAISIVPNANNTVSDLAVYVARGAKIKVFSPGIEELGLVDETYQEWSLSGRNRRLADPSKPYTIYARLSKNDKANGYLLFVSKIYREEPAEGEDPWYDKYNYVTREGVTDIDGAITDENFWYIRLGDVTLPVAGQRTVDIDTGILTTDQYNMEWGMNPDDLPLRVEIGCTIDDEDAGPTPYVQWGKSLVLSAALMEGWSNAETDRFDHWEIVRNTGVAEDDEAWNHPEGEGSYRGLEDSSITLTHSRGVAPDGQDVQEEEDVPAGSEGGEDGEGGEGGDVPVIVDDFGAAVATVFTVIAWGRPDGQQDQDGGEETPDETDVPDGNDEPAADDGQDTQEDGQDGQDEGQDDPEPQQFVALASASITIFAETIERYELELSSTTVTYSSQSDEYSPSDGVDVHVRAVGQRGNVFRLTKEQLDAEGLTAETAAVGADEWDPLPFNADEPASVAEANVGTEAFLDGKSLNVRLLNAGGNELTRNTIAYVREGADGTSPFVADLDNEMDSVACDASGNAAALTSLYAKISAFYGSFDRTGECTVQCASGNNTTGGTVRLVPSSTYTESGTDISTAQSMADAQYIRVEFTQGSAVAARGIVTLTVVHPIHGTRTLVFTVNGVRPGVNGEPATVYSILPSADVIKRGKDGTLSPASPLTVNVQKVSGTNVSNATSSDGTLRYRIDGDITSSSQGTEMTIGGTVAYPSSVSYITLAFFVGPMLRDKERIPVVFDGNDGTSPFVADLDNEMDSVACDASGNAAALTRLYAKISAFYGSTEKTSECTVQCPSGNNTTGGTVQLVSSRTQTTGGTDISAAQPMADAQYIRVAFAQGDAVAARGTVTLTVAHPTYGTRTLVFTVNGVRPGANGEPATIYSILPSADVIKRGKDGALSPASPLTVNVQKVSGTNVSNATSSDGTLRYCIDGDITSSSQGTEMAIGGTVAYTSSVGYITLAFFVGTTLRDKERIPVVFDGSDGTSPFVADLDNEMDSVACDAGGNAAALTRLYTKISAFYGSFDKTSECTVQCTSNDFGANATVRLVSSSSSTATGTDISSAASMASAQYVRVQFAEGASVLQRGTIVLTVAHSTYGTRTLVFTVNGVRPGANGEPATVYSILPSADVIKRGKDGTLSPASPLTVGVQKVSGTNVSNATSSDGTLRYRIDGDITSASQGTEMTIGGTVAYTSSVGYITLAFFVGTTLRDKERIPVVFDGSDGTSPFVADLDNEMDSVACDAGGNAAALTRLYTKVSAFYGSTEKTSECTVQCTSNTTGGTVQLVSSNTQTTGGTNISTATSMASAQYIRVEFAQGSAVTARGTVMLAVAHPAYGTRTLVFTVNGVRPGANGEPATIYNLLPDPPQISVGRTDNGGYSPATVPFKCGYTRNVGGTITEVADSRERIDGKYDIFFRKRTRATGEFAGTHRLYRSYIGGSYSDTSLSCIASIDVAKFDAIEMIICTASADFQNADLANYTVIDRETIPVVADGMKGDDGTSPFVADLDNEMDSVACDASGNAAALTRLYTKVSAFYGSTEKTSECTVQCTSNNTGGTVQLVSSNTQTTSGTNISSATSMSSAQYIRVEFAQGSAVAARGTVALTIVHSIYGTRTLVFTVNGVRPGANGEPATIFSIIPSADVIKRGKDGTLSPASPLTVGVQKVSGTSVSNATSSDGTLRYRIDGDITSSSQGTEMTIGGTVAYTSSASYITLAFFVGTTLRDKERIPVVFDGSDGTSPFIADLDNEMDSVTCDAGGNAAALTRLYTKVSAFYGSTEKTSECTVQCTSNDFGANATVRLVPSGSSTATGTDISSAALMTDAQYVRVQFAKDASVLQRGTIVLTVAHSTYGTRTLVFTVNGVRPGADGEPATIYNLLPDPPQISVGRTDGGGYSPSEVPFKCGYTRNVGGMITEVADSRERIDGKYDIFFRKRTRSTGAFAGQHRLYRSYISGSYSVTSLNCIATIDVAKFDAIELIICTASADFSNADIAGYTVIDREVIPVVADGMRGDDGTSPFIADLDNEMDSVACDAGGNAAALTRLYTKVSAFCGSTEKTSECTVQCTSNTTGGTVQLVSSNTQTTGGTNISTATSMSSAQYVRVAFAQGDAVTPRGTVALTVVHPTYGTRTLVFTVNGVRPGANGETATIYNLLPDKTQIGVGRTSGGSYSPSAASLRCGYTKNVGGTITEHADARDRIDSKYYIYYRKRTRSTQAWQLYYYRYDSYVESDNADYTLTDFSVETYDQVEFIICTATADRFLASGIGSYTVIDRETIPVVADGMRGDDGTSPFIADLDNEMDSVACDAGGNAAALTRLYTKVSAFYGSTEKTSECTVQCTSNDFGANATVRLVPSGSSTATGTDISSAASMASAQYVRVQFAEGASVLQHGTIVLSIVHSTYGTRTLTFTVNGVRPGADGETATIYNLLPDPPQISVGRTDGGGYSPSEIPFKCGYTRNVGGTITEVADSRERIDGKYDIFFRKRTRSTGAFAGQHRLYRSYISGSYSVTSLNCIASIDVAKFDAVEMIICTASADFQNADIASYTVIDREVIPVVADGMRGDDGTSPFVADLDNEMDSVPCDASGNAAALTRLYTKVSAFYGSSDKTSECTVQCTSNDFGANATVRLVPSGSSTATGTDISSAASMASAQYVRVQFAEGASVLQHGTIVLSIVHSTYGTRTLTFTVNGVRPGANGEPATIFSIIPSADVIKRGKDGTLSPASPLTVGVQKVSGTSVSSATSSDGTLRYRIDGDITSSSQGTEMTIGGTVTYTSSVGYITLAFFVGTTLRDKERIPVVFDGSDGTSPWIADLDNEMDSVSCDDSGFVMLKDDGTSQTVSTVANLYYGSDRQNCKITGVMRNSTPMTNGAPGDVTATWPSSAGMGRTLTISYAGTAVINVKDTFEITVTDGSDGNAKTLYFTVNGIKGDVYNLFPGSSSIVGVRNSDGTLAATGIICGYTRKKLDGSVETVSDVGLYGSSTSALLVDGKYNIWYRRHVISTGDWEKGIYNNEEHYRFRCYSATSYNPEVTSAFDPNTYDAIEFLLCTRTGNQMISDNGPAGVIDREIVPVVANGMNGTNPFVCDLDNEMDSVACDAGGNAVALTRLYTKISAFYGSTEKTSECTVQCTSNDFGASATVRLVPSGSSTATGTDISSAASMASAQYVRVQFAAGASVLQHGTIVLSIDHPTYGTRTLTFTVNGVRPGANGEPATIYNLLPDPPQISVGRTDGGGYSPSEVPFKCGYTRNVGGTITEVADSRERIDGKYDIFFRKRTRSTGAFAGQHRLYRNYISGSYSITSLNCIATIDVAKFDAIEMIICTASADFNNADLANYTVIDRETIPVVADGMRGDDGTSPFVADLDNEMDSVACDASGNAAALTRLYTKISAFYGSFDKTSECTVQCTSNSFGSNAVVRLVTSGSSTATGTDISSAASMASAQYVRVQFASGVSVLQRGTIVLTVAHSTYGTRTLTFTVNGVRPGADGEPATIYNLLPDKTQINVGRTSGGGYSPSAASLRCGYTKNVGGTITEHADARSQIDSKYYIYYIKRTRSTQAWQTYYYRYDSYVESDNANYTLTDFNVETYDQVELVICTATAERFLASGLGSYTVIDRETIPVVADGMRGDDGTSPFVADLDNEMDSVACDASGNAAALTRLYTKISAFYGSFDKTSECTVQCTSNSFGSNAVVRLVTSGSSTATGTDISSAASMASAQYVRVQFASGVSVLQRGTIVLTVAHSTYGTRTLTFTVNGVRPGANGEPATIFSIIPSADVIKRGKDGTLSPASPLTINVQKVSGSSVSSATSSDGTLRYRLDGDITSSSQGTEMTIGGTVAYTSSASYITLAFFVGTTLRDKERIPVVFDGSDGTSPFVADLDNEMDSVACDAGGNAAALTRLYTKVSAFYGSTEKTSECTVQCTSNTTGGTVQLVSSNTQTTGGTNISSATSMASAQYIRVAFAQGDAVAARGTVALTVVHSTYGTRTLTFTVNSVRPGANGEPATVYNLLPDPPQISIGRTDSGGYSPSTASFKCGYTRNVGGTITEVADSRERIDGKYDIFFRKRTRSTGAFAGQHRLYRSYISGSYSVTSLNCIATIDVAKFDAIEMIICTASADFQNADIANYMVIDREVIPVVADGTKGADSTVPGPPGDDAVLYSLEATPGSLNFRSDAVGTFTASLQTTCKVMKTEGADTPVELSPVSSKYDGKYYLYYRRVNSNGTVGNPMAGTTATVYSSEVVVSSASAVYVVAIEFLLSTASGVAQVADSNIVKRSSVGISVDGHRGPEGPASTEPGPPGATGKMFYSMGEWVAQSYSRTELYVPMVHYDDGEFNEATGKGNYYWLQADSASPSDVPNPNATGANAVWVKAQGFGVVITQGLFAEFAKMGKAIMSGDYMFSMNGRIGSTEYIGGATIGGVPAYTRFCGDPAVLSGTDSRTIQGPIVTDRLVIATMPLSDGVTISVSVTATRSSGTGYFCIYFKGTRKTYQSFTSGTATKTLTLTTTEQGDYSIEYYGSSYTAKFTYTLTYSVTGYFEPNWWVDLYTGKMSAARGNFVVDANGDVHVKSGDVDVSGTIRAKTLFRSYQSLMLSHGNTDSFAANDYICDLHLYMQGKFKNNDGTYSEITPQFTELPDVLFVGCRVTYSQSNVYTLNLPRPENYQGRMIDIYGEQNMGLTVNASGSVTGYSYSVVHLQCHEDGQTGNAACFVYPFSSTPRDAMFYFNDRYYGDEVHYAHIQLVSSYIGGRWLWAVVNRDYCHATNFDFN